MCVTVLAGAVASAWAAEPTSETSPELRKVLKLYPRADTDADGVLSAPEAAALRKQIRLAQLEAGTDTWRELRGKPPVGAAPARAADRAVWPVVISGADLLGLQGIPPKHLVAFQYAGQWRQIPVQVDERAVVEFHDIYNKAYFRSPCFRSLVYTDPDTFTGHTLLRILKEGEPRAHRENGQEESPDHVEQLERYVASSVPTR